MNILLSGVVGSAYERICPRCPSVLTYRHKESWVRAVARNVLCRSCSRRAQIDTSAVEKACTGCGLTKRVELFAVDTKARVAGVTAVCKDCENSRFAKKRAELAARVDALKEGQPCADCGGLFPPVCLDFDHLPGFEKRMGISRLVSTCRSWSLIEAEMAKCELVCANCHRIRTVDRRTAK